MEQLTELRNQIDELDGRIIELLDARFEVTRQVGELKRQNEIEVEHSDREQAIFARIADSDLIYEDQVAEVYRALLGISKGQQRDE